MAGQDRRDREPSCPAPAPRSPSGERRRRRVIVPAPTPDPEGADDAPTTRSGRARRVAPFAAVAVLAQLSALLPPGPRHPLEYLGSAGLLLLTALLVAVSIRLGLGPVRVAAMLLYTASWALLTVSDGGANSPLVAVSLVPVLWAAAHERPWVSWTAVAWVTLGVAAVAAAPPGPAAADLRRLVVWVAACAFASISTQAVRRRLLAAIGERDELLRQDRLLAAAQRDLYAQRQPTELLRTACRLAASIATPPGSTPRRATYLRIADGQVRVEAAYDTDAAHDPRSWPLSDHPYLATILHLGQAVAGPLDPEIMGPALRAYARATGVTHGAWVPVAPNGELDGVLTVLSRDDAVSDQQVHRLAALARVLEPALGNALTNDRVESEALTDPLTGLLNRRGLVRAVSERRQVRSVAVLSVDVDGLKRVNDTKGHAAGDTLILTVAGALAELVRSDDVAARVGGDEFLACLFDVGAPEARVVATRLVEGLSTSAAFTLAARVSVGVALGGATEELATVVPRADAAMYVAKRRGGSGIEVAPPMAARTV